MLNGTIAGLHDRGTNALLADLSHATYAAIYGKGEADKAYAKCDGVREREAGRAAALKIETFEERTAATQAPRELSPADVDAKLALVGLECEHLEYVLGLSIDGLEKVPSTEEFVSAVQAIRHTRTVMIGSMSEESERSLVEAIKARIAKVTKEFENCDFERTDPSCFLRLKALVPPTLRIPPCSPGVIDAGFGSRTLSPAAVAMIT